MEFKYALKGEDGAEVFVDGVLLARQFLGRGQWHVWDMRCSSDAERIMTHARGSRCPKAARKAAVAEVRIALARAATEARALRERRTLV